MLAPTETMKTLPCPPSHLYRPSEAAIREKAHELYMRSGWIHGRDLDNWLEAEAWLTANPPADESDDTSGPDEGLASPDIAPREDD
jgi:hypothetical protein